MFGSTYMEDETLDELKSRVIQVLAEIIADLQKSADEWYYKPGLKNYTPIKYSCEQASWCLDKCESVIDVASKLGFKKEVLNKAYEIYDFRHSGEEGYTLKDGKIVKVI